MSRMKLFLDVVQDLRSLADSIQTLVEAVVEHEYSDSGLLTPKTPAAPAEPTPPPKAPNPAPTKKITKEQVRAVLAQKSHDGLTAEVQALLRRYGAKKLSDIDPECYEGLLMEAEELKNAP